MKSLLLCSYASERSHPEKIDRWITELTRYRETQPRDAKQRETVEILLRKARSWRARAQVQ
jgi:hypothetical protein